MLFSQRKKLKVTLLHLFVLCSAQHSAQPETQQVNGLVGMVFYFPERVLNSGNLLNQDLGTIAQVHPGKQSNTNLEKRYKNRLHWNNVTGVFTLSDLQIDDSGVYTVENTDGDEGKTTHIFQLTVYYVLSKPQVTVHDNISCSVVCSVENGREVTLSWYKGGEIINQTSSPDHITLSIPLKVDEQNRDSYRCEAANPVSKETAVVPHSCIESDPFKVTDGDERTQGRLIIAVICVLVVSGLVGLAIYLKRGNGHSHADSPEIKQDDVQYAEITHIKPAENQEERRGITGLESLRDNPDLTLVYYTLQ
ncbi:hepatic and glial cell adhesion molecule-like [Oncorhynchus masou masou]|uniref:hepatic and glial cell adhesion molecule-like n=1 Tax=Oncorhynchus masou masou TaxID=90313 RepID=UPI00318434EC